LGELPVEAQNETQEPLSPTDENATNGIGISWSFLDPLESLFNSKLPPPVRETRQTHESFGVCFSRFFACLAGQGVEVMSCQ
jgi:hypothetical protein